EALARLYSDYRTVTPEQLQALARKYLVDSRAWTMVVEPEPDAVAAR
ncbi:MAG: hypothetical protein IT552_13685, partial [Sphingomonadaceae bacterium]|nr:hypothetical protein [Sphingomonadaceae bacterium]